MMKILDCITTQHDPRLVALAVVICVLVSYTAASLLVRARDHLSGSPKMLVGAATAVTGFGVWTIHFVSMLAYETSGPVSYDPILTLASIAISILMAGVAFHIALKPNMAPFGGGIFGMAVALMHYTGMRALHVPGIVQWDHQLVTVSILVGIGLGVLALWLILDTRNLWGRLAGCLTFSLAICGLHYIGMTAYTVSYGATAINPPPESISFNWLAISVSAGTLFIIAIAMTGALVDQFRSNSEAAKLRAHILELMQTKRALEATSENLAMALKQAAAANEAKSQFLATMSHELRTPLNAIIGFSEILHSELFGPIHNPRYVEYAKDIKDSGNHLLGLINDILDLSRVDSGLLQLREEPTDLSEIVMESVRMVEQQAESERIELSNLMGEGPYPAHIDPQRVRQIFINILSNAVKFTPQAGSIRIEAETGAQHLIVRIIDTGIGMAAEDIPKALERFGQVDSQLARKYEGCGLGLPLSKALMELHGGELHIESTLGEGTTVLLYFPQSRMSEDLEAA